MIWGYHYLRKHPYQWKFQLNHQISIAKVNHFRLDSQVEFSLIFKEDCLILSRIKKWCLIKFNPFFILIENIPNVFKTCMVLWCCLMATFQSFSDVLVLLWWYLPDPSAPGSLTANWSKCSTCSGSHPFSGVFCFAANISLQKKKPLSR